MADTSITREEKYLEYLTGNHKGNVPKPVTRRERYLYELCLKGMGGEISPEEIKNAVNEYLEKNPVKPGATTEQAQQIEQNKTDIASLKVETGSLKEDLSTKITKFYASSQGETHLADSDNGKIMDMMLYGKSEQKQYSGKNLLNPTLQTTTQNGVTCTNNGDGTYTLNGKLSSDTIFTLFSGSLSIDNKSKIILMKNDTFADLGIVASYCAFKISSSWDDAINYPTIKEIPSGKIVQTINLILRLSKGGAPVTLTNVLIKPMIVDASLYPDATYDDFEPYTGGIPSPNPDYPQEIKSVVNPTVKVCGKNLFDKESPEKSGYIIAQDGTLEESEGFNIYIYEYIDKPYTISYKKGKTFDTFRYGIESNGIITRKNENIPPFTVKLNKGERLYLSPHTNESVVYDIQIELGSTSTAYEPYHEQTVTLPYTLNAIPVSSGGNVTIDGQQYIADYVDVERGKLVRCVKKLFLKQYQWSKAINKGVLRFYASTIDAVGIDGNKVIKNAFSISSHFTFITSTPDRIGTFITNADGTNANIGFAFSTDATTSSDDFNNWILNNKPFVFLPVLKEELPLTSEQTQAFKSLATYYPTTNISVNSEQLDGYTVFNYPISMKNGWDYVKQQIGDTRDYIYDMDARTQDTDLQAAEAYVNSEYAVALTELEV